MSVSYEALMGAMKLVADGIITPEQANELLNGCATACMTCGAQVPDLGPLKTAYFCDACKPDKPRGGFEFL